jgi:sec-independent protein translocase protein TatA
MNFVGDILQPTHLLFILVVALLVLGPKRLPEVGRSLGRGLRDFRSAMSGDELRDLRAAVSGEETGPKDQPAAQAPPAAQAAPMPEWAAEAATQAETTPADTAQSPSEPIQPVR